VIREPACGLHQGQQPCGAAQTGRTHGCTRPVLIAKQKLLRRRGRPHMDLQRPHHRTTTLVQGPSTPSRHDRRSGQPKRDWSRLSIGVAAAIRGGRFHEPLCLFGWNVGADLEESRPSLGLSRHRRLRRRRFSEACNCAARHQICRKLRPFSRK
jgi:hypothetical protein